jgi:hypothetical protein
MGYFRDVKRSTLAPPPLRRTRMVVSGNPDVLAEAAGRHGSGSRKRAGGRVKRTANAAKDVGAITGKAQRARLDRPARRSDGRIARFADGGSLGLGVSFDPYAYAAAQRLGAPGANPLDAMRQRLAAPSATPFNKWATGNDPRVATVRT